MPIPKPKKEETEKEFIPRCMSDEIMKKEFPDHKQRVAVCFSQFGRKNEDLIEKIDEYIK